MDTMVIADYDAHAAQFETKHGFPAPSMQDMTNLPEWPIPFCCTCCDWHFSEDDHSGNP